METGSILEGRYEIKDVLGEGGFSKVYLAYDREKNRNWAIKEICRERVGDDRAYQMLKREAETIWNMKYPYFPEVEEMIETSARCYIVMEYLQGETLEEMLGRLGPLPPDEVAKWGRDLCLVLGYLHRTEPPFVYGDMKPENIMRQPGGNLRLMDFGSVWRGEYSQKRIRLGTKGYAAPEQMERGGNLDARTDIFGIGATMYRLLTGADVREFPAKDYHIRHWDRKLPRSLDKIVWKCTREKREERYPSCEELERELDKEWRRLSK